MKRIITVREFVEGFLEPLQQIKIVDFESDHVYYTGRADILETYLGEQELLWSARIQMISQYHGLTEPDGIEISI